MKCQRCQIAEALDDAEYCKDCEVELDKMDKYGIEEQGN